MPGAVTTPLTSLAILARTAYRPPERPAVDASARFEAAIERETVSKSPAVRIELTAEARRTILSLQELGLARPGSAFSSAAVIAEQAGAPYEPPGGRLDLMV